MNWEPPSQHTYRKLPYDREAIDKYVEVVDKLNAAELKVIGVAGAAAVWTIYTFFTGGLTAFQAATAIGISSNVVENLYDAIKGCQRAWELYVQ